MCVYLLVFIDCGYNVYLIFLLISDRQGIDGISKGLKVSLYYLIIFLKELGNSNYKVIY